MFTIRISHGICMSVMHKISNYYYKILNCPNKHTESRCRSEKKNDCVCFHHGFAH